MTVRRTLERRPVTQGGTDHSSHRLVYYGLSEQQAVAALTLLAALLGATALAYNVLANARVTAVGLLISFVVLVQFASFLGDLQERSRREDPGPAPPLWRAFFSNPRRLVEVLTDFGIICFSFLVAYLLFVDGGGTNTQRGALPRDAADPARRPLRPLRPLRDLPADLALRVGARPARDRRRGRAVGADHDRDRQGDPLASSTSRSRSSSSTRCSARRSSAASRLVLRLLPGLSSVRAHAEARPDRRRRPLGPGTRARAGRDAGDAGRRVRRRQPGAAPAADPRRHRPRRPRRRRAAARRAPGRRGAR